MGIFVGGCFGKVAGVGNFGWYVKEKDTRSHFVSL